jgi:exodeoxyribonuclease VII large subunit
VLLRGRVSLYEGRGEFQIIVEHVEDAREGALRRAFEALKQRLAVEGLFDTAHKKPLPRLPRRIGIITSPSGAVIHDVLTTLRRRFPAIPVLLYPVPVQGEGAADKIAAAIRLAGARADCDALILARGGGSLEDLWAFNEEIVARAIADCPIPIVTGIGHEVDFTIADFVADARAPTPTAAAELLSPHQDEWLMAYAHISQRLTRTMRQRLERASQHLDWLGARLVHPRQRIALMHERLKAARRHLTASLRALMAASRAHQHALEARLGACSPTPRLRAAQLEHTHLDRRLRLAIAQRLRHDRERVHEQAARLNTLSPLGTLARGYAIVRKAGAIVRDVSGIRPGDKIEARVAHGELACVVESSRET